MVKSRIGLAAARSDQLTVCELFDVSFADGSILRFTPSYPTSVSFANKPYQALPITAKGFKWSGIGASPRPLLEVSNHVGLFSAQLDNPDLIGCPVIRTLTFLDECDAPLGQGGGASFTPESWVIERISRLDESQVSIELASEADLEHMMLPARVMLADLCQHRYRRWDQSSQSFDYSHATCPYTGVGNYDSDGQAVSNSALDQCSLRLSTGCKKRFRERYPFLGFPGLH